MSKALEELEKQREYYKEEFGIDIFTDEGQNWIDYFVYKQDKSKFINDLVCIEDKDTPGVVINFTLWPEQQEVLHLLETERRVVTLKARQLGLTWLALADTVHELVFKDGYSANSISQTEDPDVKELIRRVGFILKYLPNWLIVSEDAEDEEKEQNITGITYKQKVLNITINKPKKEPSVFKGFSSSPGAARSFTANRVIMDEWAFHPMAHEIWNAAYPTINRPTGGQIIGISTAEAGTLHEEIWNNATWEYGGESGSGHNSFVGVFLPWDVDPKRDQKWYEETKADMTNGFHREYPSSPSEAFSAGEGAMFTEWNPKIHVVYEKNWYPPSSWRIVFAYDGGYNRAAGMWYAISPDGWVIGYREYYPAHRTDPEQAEDIRMLSKDPDGVPEQIDYIVADTSCWAKNKDTGKTTIEIMEEHGIRPWRQADKDRIMGWRRTHEFLTPLRDEERNYILDRHGDPLAKFRVTKACSNFIRLTPGLRSHKQKPDDLAGNQEDHLHDQFRYFCMSRPRPKVSKRDQKRINQARKRKIKPRSSATGY